MKRTKLILSLILAIVTLLSSCMPNINSGNTDTTTAAVDDVTTVHDDSEMPDGTTASNGNGEEQIPDEDTRKVVKLPEPFIDIELGEDGSVFDEMKTVSCTVADSTKGSVVTKKVRFDGKEYDARIYELRKEGGVVFLKYENLTSSNELLKLLQDGFTMEAFLVNHVALKEGDVEHCMVSSCQSGGYNLTTHQGIYKGSFYTDGAYRNPTLNGKYSTTELTHLVATYDATSKKAALYVNGEFVSEIDAPGALKLANGEAWRYIVIGGDIDAKGGASTLCSSFDLLDFKMYSQSVLPGVARTMFEKSEAELTGKELDYDIEYFKGSGTDAIFDSVSNSFATDVYEPETKITLAPTILQYADSELVDVAYYEKRPATIIFGVSSDGEDIYGTDRNGKEIGYLKNLVLNLNKKIIPAFVIEPSQADLIRDLINENNIGDCFVICKSERALKNVCDYTRSARPVLDIRGDKKADAADAYLKASYCGSKVVLVNLDQLDQDNALAMRARSLSIFADHGENSAENIHNAIFIGSVGIVTGNYEAVIDYYEKFENTTLSAPTLIVAHRGDVENHPHNVMSSFISAAQSGANIAELDVWMTSDGHLVLNHDATTTGFDKALTCTESTRAQLKVLKSTSPLAKEGDEIAFYDELMEYFSKNYKDLVFIVEIKDRRNEVIDLVMKQTKEYGMEDRILIICTTHSIVRYAYEKYGIGIQMNRSYMLDTNNPEASIASACIECAQLKTSFFTRWQESYQPFANILRHRGIKYSPWTTNSALDTDKHYLASYPEFTTNYPHCTDTYVRYITATVANDGTLTVQRVSYDGSTSDITDKVKLVVLDGNVKLEGGKLSGNGTFVFEYEAELPLYKEQTYFVYSMAYTN